MSVQNWNGTKLKNSYDTSKKKTQNYIQNIGHITIFEK